MLLIFPLLIFFSFNAPIDCLGRTIHVEESHCKLAVKGVAEILSDLYYCLTISSTKTNVCKSCISKYQTFSNALEIFKHNVTTVNGQSCFLAMEKLDESKIFSKLVINVSKLWQESHCPKCFPIRSNFSESDFEYQKIFLKFIHQHSNLMDCVQPFTSSNVSMCDIVDFPTNSSFNNSACKFCGDHYKTMAKSYLEIREHFSGEVCADIENLFACARAAFEGAFSCERASAPFSSCWPLAVLLASTLVFYSCSPVCRDRPQLHIYAQRRVVPALRSATIPAGDGASLNSVYAPLSLAANPTYEHEDGPANRLAVPRLSRSHSYRY